VDKISERVKEFIDNYIFNKLSMVSRTKNCNIHICLNINSLRKYNSVDKCDVCLVY